MVRSAYLLLMVLLPLMAGCAGNNFQIEDQWSRGDKTIIFHAPRIRWVDEIYRGLMARGFQVVRSDGVYGPRHRPEMAKDRDYRYMVVVHGYELAARSAIDRERAIRDDLNRFDRRYEVEIVDLESRKTVWSVLETEIQPFDLTHRLASVLGNLP